MIPNLIHLVWYGPKSLPDAYWKNIDRWKLLCAETEWLICLWDDEGEQFRFLRELLYDNGADPVQVANIMRLAILYQYGGLYVDCDIIPLRLPVFEKSDCLNLFSEMGGDKKPRLNNGSIAAPPKNRHVREMLWWCLQNMIFGPRSKEEHLKAGASMFQYFPDAWFEGVEIHGINCFYPVSWPQAHALNIMERYTYEQWLTLAESFLRHPEVLGVHTYDSTWIYKLNRNRHMERNPDNELDTSEGEQESVRAAVPDESA